ncbi:MAG: hypothetical protein WAV38_05235 [Xanthobacteraceae bacterium]
MRQETGADLADVFFAKVANQRATANLLKAIQQTPVLALGVVRLGFEAVTAVTVEVFLDYRTHGVRAECHIALTCLDMIAP